MPFNLDNVGITTAAMSGVFAQAAAGRVVNIAATTYTLQPSDSGKYLRFTAAGAVTLNVPQDAAHGSFPQSAMVNIEAAGAGGVTVAGTGSAVVHGITTLAQYAAHHLRKVAPNLYTVY